MPPLEFVMEFAKGLREAMSLGFLIFFGYVIYVQNLCKWRETNHFLYCFSYIFTLFFVLRGEGHKI